MTLRQKKILFIALAIILGFTALSLALRRPASKPAIIEMWGTNNPASIFSPLINSFQKKYPRITVRYTQKDAATYYNALLQAFADNKAPDIFVLPGNWLPVYKNKIVALDLTKDKDLNLRLFQETYPQIVQDDLIDNNVLFGMPLSIDTLALYYNRDLFEYYKIPLPPQSWDDVLKMIPKLRKINSQGQITRAALALGTSENVRQSADILSALMMQLGSPMADKQYQKIIFDDTPSSSAQTSSGVKALKYYTQFANSQSSLYTWNGDFPNSPEAFYQGKAAMMLDYNQAQAIIKKNAPDLRYGIAPFPGIAGSEKKINYGKTMNAVVSSRSLYTEQAWQFLKHLGEKQSAQYYLLQTKNPPARLDLITLASNDAQMGVFASQILTSRDWYEFDFQKVNSAFDKMIDDLALRGVSPEKAISDAAYALQLEWQQQIKSQ